MRVWVERIGKKTYGFWRDFAGRLHGKYKDYKSAKDAWDIYLKKWEFSFKVKKQGGKKCLKLI